MMKISRNRPIRLSYSSERTVIEIAESLGINPSLLHRWRRKYTPDGAKTQMAEKDDEMSKLRLPDRWTRGGKWHIKERPSSLEIKNKTGWILPVYRQPARSCHSEVGKNIKRIDIRFLRLEKNKGTAGCSRGIYSKNYTWFVLPRRLGNLWSGSHLWLHAPRWPFRLYPLVKRIMDEEGLKSIHIKRRQRSLTDSRKARGDEFKNLTKDREITEPLQVISSDISYIRTGEGFDYLCQIRDVKTNTVLAFHQSDTMKAELVEETLRKLQNRWKLPKKV